MPNRHTLIDPNDPSAGTLGDAMDRETHSEQLVSTVEVLLQADPGDGNDLVEASVELPFVPRVGDTISVWNAEGGWRNPNGMSGEEVYLEIIAVQLHTWAPERITVQVRITDCYDREELYRAFDAIRKGEQP